MFKSILKHSTRYFTTSLFTAGLSFGMLKFYTTILTPSEFGVFSMYFVMVQYIAMLVFFNDGGFNIIYFKVKDKKEFINLNISFMIILSIILFVIGIIIMPYIVSFISKGTYHLYIIAFFIGIGAGFIKMFNRILINEEMSEFHRKVNVLQSIFNHGFSFLLMFFFKLGVFGRLLGQLNGQIISIVQVLKILREKLNFKFIFIFNFIKLKETILLSWPIFISSLMVIVFSYTDRIFLKYFNGLENVGIYSFGYTIGQSLLMINEAVSLAFYPKVMNLLNEDFKKNIKIISNYNLYFSLFLLFITIILALSSHFIVNILSNEEYEKASYIIPIIFLSFLFGGFYKIPSMILSFHKITKFYPFLSFVSFGINAILNYLFIPKYGIQGAAWATVVSSFIYSFYINFKTWKYISNFKYYFIISFIYVFSLLIFICLIS
jgi:O-antigen/teichoic acid export membrane protein